MAAAKEVPYGVEILVPGGGLGERLEELLDFRNDPQAAKYHRTVLPLCRRRV